MSLPDNTLDFITDIKNSLNKKVSAKKAASSLNDEQLKQRIINVKISYKNVCMRCNHGVFEAVDLFEKEKSAELSDENLNKLLVIQQASSPISLFSARRQKSKS